MTRKQVNVHQALGMDAELRWISREFKSMLAR